MKRRIRSLPLLRRDGRRRACDREPRGAILATLPPPEKLEPEIHEPTPEEARQWHAARLTDGSFAVSGKQIERIAAMTNFDNDEAVSRFQRVLEATGITKRLEQLGARDASPVHVGDCALAWVGSPEDDLIDDPDVETDLFLAEEDVEPDS